ncbi:MAG: ABC transporter permease [Myxococcota bacterium]
MSDADKREIDALAPPSTFEERWIGVRSWLDDLASYGPLGVLTALAAWLAIGIVAAPLALLAAPIWFWRRGKYLGAFGALILLITVLAATFAPWLAPHSYEDVFLTESLRAPDATFPLGTDIAGRDLLSRIIYGAEVTVLVGFGTVIGIALLSTLIGLISGYVGGTTDMLVQRFVDIWIGFPAIFLILSILAIFGTGGDGFFGVGRGPDIGPQAGFDDRWLWQVLPRTTVVILTLSVVIAGSASRVIRGSVLQVKNEQYVEAARALGASHGRIILSHILPNILPTVIVLSTLYLAVAILAEAAISFLGFGVVPPYPTWGQMLSGLARVLGPTNWWIAVFPGLAIFLAVYGINMMGDAMRDLLDPRLRGSQ